MRSDVRDIKLAPKGKTRIEWADMQMPVLKIIREKFAKEKSLKGVKLAACLHVTTETANLCRTLKAGGAEVALCASNPLSTQDDVAASLAKDFGINVFSIYGEDTHTYYSHIESVLAIRPLVTLDDGGDLINVIHTKETNLIPQILASMEETTTGVNRLRAMERSGLLKIPVVAVNDAKTKYLFDNRYGTGQSALDGILRATNVLFAGKNVVVVGYGWCGRGFATRARGMGAKVIVVEVDEIRALKAAMDGFLVLPMKDAARIGDIFVTFTGNKHVIRKEHFELMKDGAIACNAGHFDIELDLVGLKTITKRVIKKVRRNVDQYILENGRRIFILGEGRLVNLVCAEGHPAAVMDMSFSTQALMVEYVASLAEKLPVRVNPVPDEIEKKIARLKLRAMGITIDEMTEEQRAYLAGWQEGT